jgi:hypothetical protein
MGLRATPTDASGADFGRGGAATGRFCRQIAAIGPPLPSRPLSYAQMTAKSLGALLSAAFMYVALQQADLPPNESRCTIQYFSEAAKERPHAKIVAGRSMFVGER